MLRHRHSPNFYAFYRLLHVMDAQDVGTLHQRDGVKHRCAIQRLLGRGAQQSVYHRFPGDAYQHGQVQHLHALQLLHHGIVLFQRLAEAETWVQDDVLLSHRAQRVYRLGTVQQHIFHRALARHVDVRYSQTADHLEHGKSF